MQAVSRLTFHIPPHSLSLSLTHSSPAHSRITLSRIHSLLSPSHSIPRNVLAIAHVLCIQSWFLLYSIHSLRIRSLFLLALSHLGWCLAYSFGILVITKNVEKRTYGMHIVCIHFFLTSPLLMFLMFESIGVLWSAVQLCRAHAIQYGSDFAMCSGVSPVCVVTCETCDCTAFAEG